MPRSKNAWRYTSTPQYAFMAWCLVKHRDNFNFTFTKLGKNATDSCGLLSDAGGEEAMENSSVFNDMNGSKWVARTWKIIKDVSVQDITELTKILKKVRNLVHSERRISIRTMAVQRNLDKETVTQAQNLAQRLDCLP
jgi:hypothetical protein